MGTMDLTGAERPTRNRVGGSDRDRAAKFSKRMPPSARRSGPSGRCRVPQAATDQAIIIASSVEQARFIGTSTIRGGAGGGLRFCLVAYTAASAAV